MHLSSILGRVTGQGVDAEEQHLKLQIGITKVWAGCLHLNVAHNDSSITDINSNNNKRMQHNKEVPAPS